MKRKTRIERVYNEDTGWFETREVELYFPEKGCHLGTNRSDNET